MNAGNKNTPSTHHPRRRNVTTLMVGLKNGHIRKNLTQRVNPRDIAGERKKKKKKKKKKAKINCGFSSVKLNSLAVPSYHVARLLLPLLVCVWGAGEGGGALCARSYTYMLLWMFAFINLFCFPVCVYRCMWVFLHVKRQEHFFGFVRFINIHYYYYYYYYSHSSTCCM